MRIVMEELTLKELEDLQQIIKQPVSKAFNEMSAQTMRALWFIVSRRDNPDYQWADTEKVTMAEFTAALEDEPDPLDKSS